MRMPWIFAVWAGLGATPAAFAGDAPETAVQCLQMAFGLAQVVEGKQLPDEDFKKLDELMTTLESQCDAQQFKEALASANDIKSKFGVAP